MKKDWWNAQQQHSELQEFQILNINTKWSIYEVSWASAGITASPCCQSRIKLARAALVGFRVLLMEREKGQPASFQNVPSAIKPQTSIFKLLWVWAPHCCSHSTKNSTYLGKLNTTQFCRLPAPVSPNTGIPIQGSNLPRLEESHFFWNSALVWLPSQDCPCTAQEDNRYQELEITYL